VALQPLPIVRAAASLAAVAATVSFAGCGGGTSAEPLAQQSISDQVSALRAHLVAQREVDRARVGSVNRAFLSYWRAVQFADAQHALNAFESGFATRSERSCSRWRSTT